MCGRYVSRDQAAVEREYDIRIRDPFEQIYNAAPTMPLPVLTLGADGLNCMLMSWGLVPAWWSKPEPPTSTINARIEEAASKPMWRQAVRRTRCLVAASGWFEWQKAAGDSRKQPFYIHPEADQGISFAGLWSTYMLEGSAVNTFAIMTRAAAPELAHIHNRMPVVLPKMAWDEWLQPATLGNQALLENIASKSLTHFASHPVSTYVNSPRNQGARCIEALKPG